VEEKSIKVIVQNRKARHDYEILETYETGIALVGTEVKSIRAGKVQMKDSYATIEDGELYLHICISLSMIRGVFSTTILFGKGSF